MEGESLPSRAGQPLQESQCILGEGMTSCDASNVGPCVSGEG